MIVHLIHLTSDFPCTYHYACRQRVLLFSNYLQNNVDKVYQPFGLPHASLLTYCHGWSDAVTYRGSLDFFAALVASSAFLWTAALRLLYLPALPFGSSSTGTTLALTTQHLEFTFGIPFDVMTPLTATSTVEESGSSTDSYKFVQNRQRPGSQQNLLFDKTCILQSGLTAFHIQLLFTKLGLFHCRIHEDFLGWYLSLLSQTTQQGVFWHNSHWPYQFKDGCLYVVLPSPSDFSVSKFIYSISLHSFNTDFVYSPATPFGLCGLTASAILEHWELFATPTLPSLRLHGQQLSWSMPVACLRA